MASKKNKPYSKLVKTSKKSHKTFTTEAFVVTDADGVIDDTLKEEVARELCAMSELMRKNEDAYYDRNFRRLVKELADAGENTRGRKNAALRAYVDDIPYPPETQPYNFKEMLRYNIASKTDIYITRYKTESLIKNLPDASPREIKQAYNEIFDDASPSLNEIKKYISAVRNSGHIDGDPHSNGQLPISATDGHYRHLAADGSGIHLSLKMACGEVTLHFEYPKNKGRYEGKCCAPTIRCKDGRLLFDFAVQKDRPSKKLPKDVRGFIGVDAGEKTTASFCFVGRDKTISQPFLETRRIWRLEDQIADLFNEISCLRDKASLCDRSGFFDKSEELWREAELRRARISRLKKQVNELVACEIVRAAVVLNAGIAVEELGWVPESHWDQADLQERLRDLAADHGLPVVKVSAAHTSSTCPKCGGKMVDASGRRKRCSCGFVGDRDVIAARNIGARACGFWDCCGFSYKLVSLGSRAFRRECGVLARCNKLRPSDVPDDRVSSSGVLASLGDSFAT